MLPEEWRAPEAHRAQRRRLRDAPGARATAGPSQAWRVDNDFTRLFHEETLVGVETLNLDAASFAQMEGAARAGGASDGDAVSREVAHIVLRTVSDRGKQHNPVTGSGGMLLGRVLQAGDGQSTLRPGDRIASLVSLSLTPLRVDGVRAVRRTSAQIDVDGEAVPRLRERSVRLCASPTHGRARGARRARRRSGAAPQVARLVAPDHVVVVLGAGGAKSGVLSRAEARRRGGPGACVIRRRVEPHRGRGGRRSLGLCDAVVSTDARDADRGARGRARAWPAGRPT